MKSRHQSDEKPLVRLPNWVHLGICGTKVMPRRSSDLLTQNFTFYSIKVFSAENKFHHVGNHKKGEAIVVCS